MIRFRFTEHERALLQWSRWWDCHMPDLLALPHRPIASFVNALADGIDAGSVRRTRRFDTPLADILRDGRVAGFAHPDTPLFEPAPPLDRATRPTSATTVELSVPPDPLAWLPTPAPDDHDGQDTPGQDEREPGRSFLSRWRRAGPN